MKYKHYIETLKARQAAWERLDTKERKAHKKPGSLKK